MNESTVILVLSCLGVAQALFLCTYLFTLKKGSRPANIFLAFVILGLTIRIGKSVLNVYLELDPWQRNLGISGILLTGPFLWMYGRALLTEKKHFHLKDFLHVFPFLLFAIFSFVIPNDGSFWGYAVYILVFVHLAVYLVLSFSLLNRFGNEVHPQKSKWFRNLVIGVFLIWLFYMGNLAGLISFYIGGALFFSLLIYIFSFLFLQKHAFQLGKYNASTLDKTRSKQLIDSIKSMFAKEELFLDSTLSLESVAEKLNTTPRKLSQAINQNEQKNFSDFVNGYRIEKAKNLLQNPKYKREKIVTIAYDCGFGNVTSFNLAFKAKTHRTPSQFRDSTPPANFSS
ncbi:helix-turn-helix domain-containing protein [Flagellimonas allohymeniacidonis]|uniref:Helix-turn-helix domain-containing protein n=1 Tax=Flagellimonas allohymeniacidonis TaxID=2517819 RepID=A0A4Q8QCL5_9FLAO|nr:helix-turn-helix transcriptional regulator [Allomuricauda hymeniacidonis]TAI47424.1 helix-turn-helix domain-containing protein [Allomuricauda hymeniacidonis]